MSDEQIVMGFFIVLGVAFAAYVIGWLIGRKDRESPQQNPQRDVFIPRRH